jgi:Fur family ferric uptake transcriptional regulator
MATSRPVRPGRAVPAKASSKGGSRQATASAQRALGRATRQRLSLLAIVGREARPLSPYELHELAVRELPTLGLSTVYRTLRSLEEAGEIRAVAIPGQPARYELAEVASHHHHHFHCRTCDRVYDVEGCPGGLKQLLPKGFTLEDHTIVLSGRCDRCTG